MTITMLFFKKAEVNEAHKNKRLADIDFGLTAELSTIKKLIKQLELKDSHFWSEQQI